MKTEPSAGAVRASKKICFGVFLTFDDVEITQLAQIIDKETGLKELVEALEEIMGESAELYCALGA